MIFKIINGKAIRYDSGGGITKIDDLSVDFSQAESRENISPADSMKIILGKIVKWFSDLSAGAASTLLGNNLTANKVLVSDENGKVSASETDASEVTYFYGSSDEINAAIENGDLEVGTNIYCEDDTEFEPSYNITEDRAVITKANGEIAPSDVTAQELGYLIGLTANVQDSINSLSAVKDIEIVAGNNIGYVINYCYVKNDILYLNAQAEVIGNLNRYQTIMTFSGYKATRTAISIGGTPDGKVAQIYCESNTNKILINTVNGIAVNDQILMNFCIPVAKI